MYHSRFCPDKQLKYIFSHTTGSLAKPTAAALSLFEILFIKMYT